MFKKFSSIFVCFAFYFLAELVRGFLTPMAQIDDCLLGF